MSEHTPLPWRRSRSGLGVVAGRADANTGFPDGRPVAMTSPCRPLAERLANAILIVRAVNAHADLLAACEAILAGWESVDPNVQVPDEINDDAAWAALRAAIARARDE